jgi:PII-like signaling protein
MNTLERLTIYVGESAHWHGKPVYIALVEDACRRGLAGATVTRGAMGMVNEITTEFTRLELWSYRRIGRWL